MFRCYRHNGLRYCRPFPQKLLISNPIKINSNKVYSKNTIAKYDIEFVWENVTCPNCLSLGKPPNSKKDNIDTFTCRGIYYPSNSRIFTTLCKGINNPIIKNIITNQKHAYVLKYKTDVNVTCPNCLDLMDKL